MKKLILAAVLGLSLTFCGVAAAEEYLMSPGDQLYIFVREFPDINGTASNSSIYTVRPDGCLNFPLVGDIDTTGKTVKEFMAELKERLQEFVINPTISYNLQVLGTTRVLVLGEVKKAGLYELTKSHRVADALAAAGGFTEKAAKKKCVLNQGRSGRFHAATGCKRLFEKRGQEYEPSVERRGLPVPDQQP